VCEELQRDIQSYRIPLACLLRVPTLILAKIAPNLAINAH